ncbi:MAG: hypothetical protein COX19_15515 [Desulfobacterales bacterium CG23_combo_of_CG06-09_8_20_14_all_51_8]|nr:MAG: hypothetical protein COX19_15515 [Desulfobacterales bacterium CG23_combo_of_CG06-09_8_20_14_all_51_8]
MVGIGYDDNISQKIYIHDTWDHSQYDMIWGDGYNGMDHFAVTIVRLAPPIVPEIMITSPQTGDAWQAGSAQAITWSYLGNPGAHVKIELFKNGSFNRTIVSQAPMGASGTGTYNWNIPITQTQGDDYIITVTSSTNSACVDSSGIFSITAPPDGGQTALPWLELLLLME